MTAANVTGTAVTKQGGSSWFFIIPNYAYGKAIQADGRGRFFQPTVLADVPADAHVMKNEQFGPILAVQRVNSDEEAIERMNDSAFGLTADQRGFPRPSSFAALSDADDGSDIGAVEVEVPTPVAPPVVPLPGGGGGGGGGALPPGSGSGGARFGAKTLVTLSLSTATIPAKGPLRVRVANANRFAVSGRLSGTTTVKRRHVTLKAKTLRVAAGRRATVALTLPKAVRAVLAARGRVTIRLSAVVRDGAGTSRTVRKSTTPRLKRRTR